jgi:hypothetical protein
VSFFVLFFHFLRTNSRCIIGRRCSQGRSRSSLACFGRLLVLLSSRPAYFCLWWKRSEYGGFELGRPVISLFRTIPVTTSVLERKKVVKNKKTEWLPSLLNWAVCAHPLFLFAGRLNGDTAEIVLGIKRRPRKSRCIYGHSTGLPSIQVYIYTQQNSQFLSCGKK